MTHPGDLPFAARPDLQAEETFAVCQLPIPGVQRAAGILRAGDPCPQCARLAAGQQGRLEYDGLLNLVCPLCGFEASGAGGCT